MIISFQNPNYTHFCRVCIKSWKLFRVVILIRNLWKKFFSPAVLNPTLKKRIGTSFSFWPLSFLQIQKLRKLNGKKNDSGSAGRKEIEIKMAEIHLSKVRYSDSLASQSENLTAPFIYVVFRQSSRKKSL